MTKLSEKIPIKYIKQNKGLQRVWEIKYEHKEWEFRIIPFISIADIIDNAEMLFRKHLIKIKYANWEEVAFVNYSFAILDKCFKNKSIDEISKYIIENIKYE